MKKNARKEIETDGKYKDGETDPKRKKEYDDRLAALTEAILITEGADQVDLPVAALKTLLKSTIPKFNFESTQKSIGIYEIIMIGSRYTVDKHYTTMREERPEGLTEAQDKASKNYDKAKKELQELQKEKDLDVNSPAYKKALQKEREALYEMYKEAMSPAQRKKFDQVRDPEWKKKNNITPDEEEALLAEIYGNANLTGEVDELLLRVRKNRLKNFVDVDNLTFGDNFPKKVRKHIDQVHKRFEGQIENIPSPGNGGVEKVRQIIEDRISKGGGYSSTYAGEAATFFTDGKVVYVVKENGEFWTILKNTK